LKILLLWISVTIGARTNYYSVLLSLYVAVFANTTNITDNGYLGSVFA